MKSLFTVLTFVTAALAVSRTAPPRGCVVVKKSPGSGQFGTIQRAVDSLSTTAPGSQCIWIDQGTYNEQVLVPARAAQLTVYGYTANTSSYVGNKVTITDNKSQADGLTNDETATLRVKARNFRLYNVNVANTHGKGSQAVALSAFADSGYYACQITGFQDTLLSQQGYQLYSKCMISGATDYIFGELCLAWFEQCDLRVVTNSIGYITANGRRSASARSEYVFNRCNIAAAPGAEVADGAFYLGRPWGPNAQVVFQRTSMTAVINPAGWHVWNKNDPRTGSVLFGEYQNTGAGSQGARATFSKKLSAPVAITSILGPGYASAGYYDPAYM